MKTAERQFTTISGVPVEPVYGPENHTNRGPGEFPKELARSEYVARKALDQARRFSPERLDEIYHRLLAIDEGVKTSQTSLPVALDSLVAELAR